MQRWACLEDFLREVPQQSRDLDVGRLDPKSMEVASCGEGGIDLFQGVDGVDDDFPVAGIYGSPGASVSGSVENWR